MSAVSGECTRLRDALWSTVCRRASAIQASTDYHLMLLMHRRFNKCAGYGPSPFTAKPFTRVWWAGIDVLLLQCSHSYTRGVSFEKRCCCCRWERRTSSGKPTAAAPSQTRPPRWIFRSKSTSRWACMACGALTLMPTWQH